MKMGERIKVAGPIWHAMWNRLNLLITYVNELRAIVLVGQNPHKVDDTADAISVADAANLDGVGDIEKVLAANWATHLASSSYHLAADSTNTLTATSVYAKVKALADNLKAKYNLHHVYTTSSVHAGSGDPNTVTAADVSTKATAITLLNQIKTMFNLHLANVTSCHGAADATNPIVLADLTVSATWTQIQAMADQIRTSYEAHRVLTAGSVHGAADSANGATVAAVGSVQTSVDTLLTELKGDLNAHLLLLTSHRLIDESMKETNADATTLATSITLVNSLKANFNNHISRAAEDVGVIPTLDVE